MDLAVMRARLRRAMDAVGDSRRDELDDLKFMAGSPDNHWQWPDDVLNTRGASSVGRAVSPRPCLTINKLPQHVRQVTNEQRQNRPAGKVIPADDHADIEVAEIFDGIVRHIEQISDADVAYDTACDNQVTFGEGYIRILTQYVDETSFDQELRIARVRNAFSVYLDPDIQDPCGADAKWGFITEDVTHEAFKDAYPKARMVSSLDADGVNDAGWCQDDTVRIAEYFYIEEKLKDLYLFEDGTSLYADDPNAAMYGPPVKTRKAKVPTIKWCKTNGFEILEEQDWAGRYIPIIRVVGNEFEVDGKLYVSGLIRNAKDAQRMYNYWNSQEAEMLALAPKAPFIGYAGQFQGYENQWRTANIHNWPYLEVNPDVTDAAGSVLPLPQRAAPPLVQAGLIQAKMGAADDIKATTGQYDSSLGATSNERSGKAILAREKQGDTGTYHYVDNLARAIRYVTRQLVDLIPKIYDTERVARIVGPDGSPDMVKTSPDIPSPVQEIRDQNGALIEKIYNLGVGKYDVSVTTGPSYMTKRQEATDSMTTLLQGNPALWSVAGDLFVKHMDWPGAQEMSDRLRKSLDPKLLQEDEKSPEMHAAEQHMQELSQENEKLKGMLKHIDQSIEAEKLKIAAYDAETRRISATQAGMTPEQIQDIVTGTLHAAIHSGDVLGEVPEPQGMPEAPEAAPEPMEEPNGTPQASV